MSSISRGTNTGSLRVYWKSKSMGRKEESGLFIKEGSYWKGKLVPTLPDNPCTLTHLKLTQHWKGYKHSTHTSPAPTKKRDERGCGALHSPRRWSHNRIIAVKPEMCWEFPNVFVGCRTLTDKSTLPSSHNRYPSACQRNAEDCPALHISAYSCNHGRPGSKAHAEGLL